MAYRGHYTSPEDILRAVESALVLYADIRAVEIVRTAPGELFVIARIYRLSHAALPTSLKRLRAVARMALDDIRPVGLDLRVIVTKTRWNVPRWIAARASLEMLRYPEVARRPACLPLL